LPDERQRHGFEPRWLGGAGIAYKLATFTTTDLPLKATNYSATVNFEDGRSGKAGISLANGVFSVAAIHRYALPGEYQAVQVTIHDKLDGTSQTVATTVFVDPSHTGNGFTLLRHPQTPFFVTAFGGTWRKVGRNYKNHTLTAVRISDRRDTFWTGNIQSVSVIPTPAVFSEQFGYIAGTSGGSYVNLFDATGAGATGGIGFAAMPTVYRLARTGQDGNVFTSNPPDNLDHRDHMVTYQIEGLVGQPSGQSTYVLGFEDTVDANIYDYKDLMVEFTVENGGPS